MPRFAAGELDRRILVQSLYEKRDASGDVVRSDWSDYTRLWSKRVVRSGSSTIGQEEASGQGVLRQFDMVWIVRSSKTSLLIAPETHRILYLGRVYEIVGIEAGRDRADTVQILTCARPDQRGSRANEGSSSDG